MTLQVLAMCFSAVDTLESQNDDIEDGVDELRMRSSDHPCSGTGWINVANIDMGLATESCPTGWTLTNYAKCTCGTVTTNPNRCDSTTFLVTETYSKVCGRIAFGGPDAFANFIILAFTNAGETFVDGVVLLLWHAS